MDSSPPVKPSFGSPAPVSTEPAASLSSGPGEGGAAHASDPHASTAASVPQQNFDARAAGPLRAELATVPSVGTVRYAGVESHPAAFDAVEKAGARVNPRFDSKRFTESWLSYVRTLDQAIEADSLTGSDMGDFLSDAFEAAGKHFERYSMFNAPKVPFETLRPVTDWVLDTLKLGLDGRRMPPGSLLNSCGLSTQLLVNGPLAKQLAASAVERVRNGGDDLAVLLAVAYHLSEDGSELAQRSIDQVLSHCAAHLSDLLDHLGNPKSPMREALEPQRTRIGNAAQLLAEYFRPRVTADSKSSASEAWFVEKVDHHVEHQVAGGDALRKK